MEEAQKKAAAEMLNMWREVVKLYRNNFSEARYLRAVWDLDEKPTPYNIANEAGRDGDALDIEGGEVETSDDRAGVYVLRFKIDADVDGVADMWGTLGVYITREEAAQAFNNYIKIHRKTYGLNNPKRYTCGNLQAFYDGESDNGAGIVSACWAVDYIKMA